MSTRKDGLSLRTVFRTVSYILDKYGVECCGGNQRVLHLQRRDGNPDVGNALNRDGISLKQALALHGLTIWERAGCAVVDLLECPVGGTSAQIAERVAAREEREARAEWLEAVGRGEEPVGRSADERGEEVGDEAYRWACTQTSVRLRHWLEAA